MHAPSPGGTRSPAPLTVAMQLLQANVTKFPHFKRKNKFTSLNAITEFLNVAAKFEENVTLQTPKTKILGKGLNGVHSARRERSDGKN